MSWKAPIAVGVVGFLCLFCSQPAQALKIGGMDVDILTGIEESYDDNIAYAPDNEKDDFITRLSLGLRGTYTGKTSGLSVLGRFNYDKYLDNDNYDNDSQEVYLDLFKEFSEYFRFEGGDVFTHAEDPSSFEDEFGREQGRYSYIENEIRGAFIRDISKYLTLTLSGRNGVYFPSRDSIDESYYNAASVQFDYLMSSRLATFGFYEFYHRTYEGPGTIYFNTVAGGVKYFFNSMLYTDFTAGVDCIHTLDGEDLIKPLFIWGLTQELDERSVARIKATKRNTTQSTTQALFDTWSISAELTHQLSRRLDGSVSAFYGQGEYDRIMIEDDFQGFRLGLSYELSEDITARAGYSFSKTDSNLSSRDYTRNYYSVGLTMEF